MTKGVVIIAAGAHQYGNMALNLCMGIKALEPTANVTLLCHGNATEHIKYYLSMFSSVIEIPEEFMLRNGFRNYIKSKLYLPELSPYDETILIDADVMWSPKKKISDLFKEVEHVDFTIGCRSKNMLSDNPKLIWSDARDMMKKYGDAEIFNLSSEFVYFKKTKEVLEFFDLAKQYFDEPGIDYVRFDGGVADELAFQLAMMSTKIKPHATPWQPFYWEHQHKKQLKPNDIYDDWYGYSMGGNSLTEQMKGIYNNLAKFYATKFGLKRPFLCQEKRQFAANRKHI